MESPPEGARYWLLVGRAPSGPFTVEQIHAKLAAGEITWESQACRLGTSGWLTLVETPGLGPTPASQEPPSVIAVAPTAPASPESVLMVVPTDPDERPSHERPRTETQPGAAEQVGLRLTPNVEPASIPEGPSSVVPVSPIEASAAPTNTDALFPPERLPTATVQPATTRESQRPSTAGTWAGVVFAILLVAVCGGLGYVWTRPLTPREVCKRFDNAKTAKEALQYCTLNLKPAVEAVFRRSSQGHAEDQVEYTQEGDAPANVGGYFVGVRGQIYNPKERRHVQFDGVYHLIKSDVWKIEDTYVVAVDRQPLPQPISIARDHPLLFGEQPGGQTPKPTPASSSAATASVQAKQWYDNRGVQQAAARGVGSFLTGGGAKALGWCCLPFSSASFASGERLLAGLPRCSPHNNVRIFKQE